MTEEELLKHSLLLTHGTLYGLLLPVHEWAGLAGRSASLERCCPDAATWRANLCAVFPMVSSGYGAMADQTPIDVVHWTGTGNTPYNTLAPWERCLTLMTRL